MQITFRKALPSELQSLLAFDHSVFKRSDWFDDEDWNLFESWWMIADGVHAGCCAFEKHVDFQEDLHRGRPNPRLRGSLYIASTGILPRLQGKGLGVLLKSWQISYARRYRFTRIVSNTRKSNLRMIRLNRKCGFKVIRTTRGYYHDPVESTVVMELDLTRARRGRLC